MIKRDKTKKSKKHDFLKCVPLVFGADVVRFNNILFVLFQYDVCDGCCVCNWLLIPIRRFP